MKLLTAVVSLVVTMLATHVAGAQPVPTPLAAEFDRCQEGFPGEFRNVRRSGAPTQVAPLGATYTRELCAGTFEPAQLCPPALEPSASRSIELRPGEILTVSCAGGARVRPAGPTRIRVRENVFLFCDPALGAEVNPAGTGCECRRIDGYEASAPVVVSSSVVNHRLVHTVRTDGVLQTRFGCFYVPSGAPRPVVDYTDILRGLAANDAALQRGVNENRQAIRTLRSEVERNGRDLDELTPRVAANESGLERVNNRINALPTLRLQFDGSLVGLIHWNAGSPVGALGGGFVLRPAIILRWSDSFGLRIFGGWGMGAQTNTPYHRPTQAGPIEQSAPLHQGVFGIDGILGSGSVAGILGVDGFVAGRTGPAIVSGDISGLVAWRANVHGGARIRLAGSNAGLQVNLDILVNAGVSNISASTGGRFFSTTTFGAGGEFAVSITR